MPATATGPMILPGAGLPAGEWGQGVITRQRLYGRPLPLHVILLPTIPVLALWSTHAQDVLGTFPLRLAVGVSALALCLTGLLLVVQRDMRRAALSATGLLLALTGYGYVFGPTFDHRLGLALTTLAIVGLVLIAHGLPDRHLRNVTLMLNVVGLALVTVNGLLIVASRPAPGTTPAAMQYRADGPFEAGRDVWYIVPDRHPSIDTLDEMGIESGTTEAAYRERDFDLVEAARANYPDTRRSLAAAWSLNLLSSELQSMDEAVERLQDPLIGRAFASSGYEYVHVGNWFDATASAASASTVGTLEGTGEFYDAFDWKTVLPVLRQWVPIANPGFAGPDVRHHEHAVHQLNVLEELASNPRRHGQFVLTHLLLPHPEYVFREDGTHRSTPVDPSHRADAYEEQLAYTHDRLLGIIDTLQSRDEPPIIVVMSDEGIYPKDWTPNEDDERPLHVFSPEEQVSKVSVFTAIYDPANDIRELAETSTPVTVTRALVADVLGRGPATPLDDVMWPAGDDEWVTRHPTDFDDSVFGAQGR